MKILIATGGTGGHVYPALAVAEELASRGHKITISCDGRVKQMVRDGKPKKSKIIHIWASGVGAKSRFQQMYALFKIGMSAIALTLRFAIFRPARVVAFGGYASVPAVFAAHVWRIPTFLHEQNAAIGRANKFTMRWVKTLMTSFPTVDGMPKKSSARVVYTGLPVRRDFIENAGAKLPNKSHLLMKNKKIFVTHQTRPENVEKLQMFYASHKIHANVLSFIHDMAGAIVDADLVLSRGGASTVIELETIGRPAIIVPLGINPDQAANAASFARLGGAFAIEQSKFTQKWLTATLDELFDNPSRLKKMAEKSCVENHAVKLISDTVTK